MPHSAPLTPLTPPSPPTPTPSPLVYMVFFTNTWTLFGLHLPHSGKVRL